tara:strand:+ start:253 stop:357 length:105 start_codon:yes stop_codon:yes gene_type:complete
MSDDIFSSLIMGCADALDFTITNATGDSYLKRRL